MQRGPCPSEDLLFKDRDIIGPNEEYRPLGQWLIEELKASRVELLPTAYRGGATAICDHLDAEDEKVQQSIDKRNLDLEIDMHKAIDYCASGHTSEPSAKTEWRPMDRAPSGKKRIYGPQESLRRH
jgi:hypothetical protein